MNQYHIYEEIGHGASSVVYKGRMKKTIEYVAIKRVEKAQKNKILNEVRNIHTLRSPYVLKFFNWYETSNHIWLIVEYVVGGDLLNLLMEDGRLPLQQVKKFGRDMVQALQYIHSRGILYCDLKPSNVIIDENGLPKLCDFGLSQRIQEVAPSKQNKQGTPCYMAPELFEAKGIHSFASDFWSFGCVLYELAAGRPPFTSNSFKDLVHLICESDLERLPEFTDDFWSLLKSLLAKDPGQRATWDELCQHPFWEREVKWTAMPSQPEFEAYLQQTKRGMSILVDHSAGESEEDPLDLEEESRDSLDDNLLTARSIHQEADAEGSSCNKTIDSSGSPTVNTVRLSRIAQSNMNKEAYAAKGDGGANGTDIEMTSYDQALDFREDMTTPSSNMETEVPAVPLLQTEQTGPFDTATTDEGATEPTRPSSAPVDSTEEFDIKMETRPVSAIDPPAGGGVEGQQHQQQQQPSAKTIGSDSVLDVREVLIHPSDTVVKPIVGNTKIEKLKELRFEAKLLGFKPITRQQAVQMNHEELEVFLTKIYKIIGGQTPVHDKINALSYMSTLGSDTQMANIIVNSSLMTLFIDMCSAKISTPGLKWSIAHVIGLVIRHTTYICDALSDTNIVGALSGFLRDQDVTVRRAAVSSLGELLFYIATLEKDENGQGQQWKVSSQSIAAFCRCLRQSEDSVVQHYTAKTIENISASVSEKCVENYALKFATPEVALSLLQLFIESRDEGVRDSSVVALSRLCRWNDKLVHKVYDKSGINLFAQGLTDGNSKVVQSLVNILNTLLCNPSLRENHDISDSKLLVKRLVKLLEHASVVIRGKGLLALSMVFQLHPKWIQLACDVKFMQCLERLTKDKDAHLKKSIDLVINSTSKLIPSIINEISAEIDKVTGRPHSSKVVKMQLSNFPILLHVTASSLFRPHVVNPSFIQVLSRFVSELENASINQAQSEWKPMVLSIVEALSQDTAVLVQHSSILIKHLLPVLLNLLDSDSGDTRFLGLKVFHDITINLVREESVYKNPAKMYPETEDTTTKLNELVTKRVIAKYSSILSDKEPLPLYGLKLLCTLLGANPDFIASVISQGLTPRFFTCLDISHPNNNVHNLIIVRHILESNLISEEDQIQYGVVEKLCEVTQYAFEHEVDAFFEAILEMMEVCLAHVEGHGPNQTQLWEINRSFVAVSHILIELCILPDKTLAEKSSLLLQLLSSLYPESLGKHVLVPSSAKPLCAVFRTHADTLRYHADIESDSVSCTAQGQHLKTRSTAIHAIKAMIGIVSHDKRFRAFFARGDGHGDGHGDATGYDIAIELEKLRRECILDSQLEYVIQHLFKLIDYKLTDEV